MAWNEPGGNDNDPWGNRKNSGGPPDLDEVFKNLRKKVDGAFGKRGGGRSGGSGPGLPGGLGSRGLGFLALGLVGLWLASGIYILQPAEKGVVTQFGAYKHTTDSGIHWRLPWPFQAVQRVDVKRIRTVRLRDQPVLTQDENIVDLDLAVQYTIKSASDYIFRVRDPDSTLQEVLESAVREVVGQTNMEPVITTGRDLVGISTRDTLQLVLDEYGAGIEVTAVNLERAQPPEQVQAAFSDAIKAREDRERFINEAEAYRNAVLPQARGEAQQILEQALAYKAQVEKAAEGESRRFTALLEEYEKAPDVTRDRLYLEAMEAVLSNTSKVIMDSNEGNSLMYLPIDKLLENSGSGSRQDAPPTVTGVGNDANLPNINIPSSVSDTVRDTLRNRSRGN
ncbi:MAG: FtsH protease activity modulator HflK [Gammaproteobacteria bacterium]|nr:FtsH protease activity modulator HflK [Gammaproteobacteria bacterium]